MKLTNNKNAEISVIFFVTSKQSRIETARRISICCFSTLNALFGINPL